MNMNVTLNAKHLLKTTVRFLTVLFMLLLLWVHARFISKQTDAASTK